ncbi:MAG: AAA family ATPase [Myxococcota bacterium]
MIIRRIALKHVRGVVSAEYTGLSDRMNLFYGANESGKSTIVSALYIGLFERVKGTTGIKRSLRTWGSTATPEITIELEDAHGEVWRVYKRFLDTPRVELSGRNATFTGDDAEKRLRSLFGTRASGRQGITDEDLGMWPLLWVQQGRAGTKPADALNTDTRQKLQNTLAELTGEVAAGPVGSSVLSSVVARYHQFWTATGRLNAATTRVKDAAENAQRTVADLQRQIRETAALADTVANLKQEDAQLGSRLAASRERLTDLERKEQQVATLRREITLVEQQVEVARLKHQQAERALLHRRGLQEEGDVLAEGLPALEDVHARQLKRQEHLEGQRREARVALQEVERQAIELNERLTRLRRAADRTRITERVRQLSGELERAETLEQRQRDLSEEHKQLMLHPADLERLHQLEQAHVAAKARLEAASARVVLIALQPVTVEGHALGTGATHEVRVTSSTRLTVDGVITIDVEPGEGTLAELEAHEGEAREALSALLTRMGVTSYARALARRDRVTQLEAERKGLAAELHARAPEGTSVLRQELRELQEQLSALSTEDEGAGTAAVSEAEAAEAMRQLSTVLAERRADVNGLEAPLEAAREETERCRADLQRHRDEMKRKSLALQSLAPMVELEASEANARQAHEQAQARLAMQQLAYREAGGEGLDDELEAHRQAVKMLEERRTQARERAVASQAELATRQQDGLYDRLTEAQEDEGLAAAAWARAEHEAAVARQLYDVIMAAQSNLQRRIEAPVREAVSMGVEVLFPGSELHIDDNGDVVGLRTDGQVEFFQHLSGGAKEQFGILVRLGLARVLAGERRLPVILDDALVSSDASRRNRMVKVLRRMSQYLQVLVFTCHDEDFDGLAAQWRARVEGRPGRY